MLPSIVAWLHIAAVVIAIGGSAFALLVLRPLALRALDPPMAMRLLGTVQLRFRWFIWAGIVVLVITGVVSSGAFRGIRTADDLLASSFGRTLAVKSLLALVLFANALAITLPVERLGWFRQRQVAIVWINLVLAAIIVFLASAMVRAGGVL